MIFSALLFLYVLYECYNSILTWKLINQRARSDKRVLEPAKLSKYDAVAFFFLKLIFLFKILAGMLQTTLVYLFPRMRKSIDEAHVVDFIINVSLVLFLKRKDVESEDVVVVLDLKDFASPFVMEFYECTLYCEFNVTKQTVDVFFFNGIKITEPAEMLAVLLHTNGTIAHPMIHTFNNDHYEGRNDEYSSMYLHGQSLNEAAPYYTGMLFGCGPIWLKKVLTFNGEKPVPEHSAHQFLYLRKYSSYIDFFLYARGKVFKLLKKHNVPVNNPESYVLVSVLHSLDHYNLGKYTSWRYTEHSALRDCTKYPSNLLAFIFYSETHLSTIPYLNNLLCKKKHLKPFYKDLYTSLAKKNKEYANQITLSLSS